MTTKTERREGVNTLITLAKWETEKGGACEGSCRRWKVVPNWLRILTVSPRHSPFFLKMLFILYWGGSVVRNSLADAGDSGSILGSGSRKWQPILVSLPGESHVQRSLVGYNPRGHRVLDMTEGLTLLLGPWDSTLGHLLYVHGVPSVLVSGFPSFSFPGQRGQFSRGEECCSTPGPGRVLYCQEGTRDLALGPRSATVQLCGLGEPILTSAWGFIPSVQRGAGYVTPWPGASKHFQ